MPVNIIPDPLTTQANKGTKEHTLNTLASFVVNILSVNESSGEPTPLYETVGSRDAVVEPTGTYLRRVP